MKLSFQLLGASTEETDASILVSTDNQRILFNVSEGTQRLCMEHKLRLGKMKHIFLTQLNAQTVGGLPGLILTISDTGVQGIQVHGPVQTKQYFHATRHFLNRPEFQTTVHEITHETSHACCLIDQEIFVQPIVLSTSSSLAERHNTNAVKKRTLDGNLCEHDKVRSPPSLSPESDAISYLCQSPKVPGKFLVKRALDLGVPKGPLFGKLHRGEDVTLEKKDEHGNPVIVKSSDCVGPSTPGCSFVLLTCPSVKYLPSLMNNQVFQTLLDTSISTNKDSQDAFFGSTTVDVMIHTACVDVLTHPAYQEWVAKFGSEVKHLFLNKHVCPQRSIFRASTRLQAQLHFAFPDLFNDPQFEEREALEEDPSLAYLNDNILHGFRRSKSQIKIAEGLLKYSFFPPSQQGYDLSSCPVPIDFEALHAEMVQENLLSFTSSSGSFPSSSTKSNQLSSGFMNQKICSYPLVTLLGTGSAIPSKYRNVTSIHIQISSDSSMLLDAGEGTYGQLWKHFCVGKKTREKKVANMHVDDEIEGETAKFSHGDDISGEEQMRKVLLNLRCVWISHNHADHHLGLVKILAKRPRLLKKAHVRACEASLEGESASWDASSASFVAPLVIIGPKQLGYWLSEYALIDATIRDKYVFYDCSMFEQDTALHSSEATLLGGDQIKHQLQSMGIQALTTVRVKHCYLSYAVILQFPSESSGSKKRNDEEDGDTRKDESQPMFKKVVYSGDCRPSETLIQLGQGADLLIHEATFEDDLAHEAEAKNHSTTLEALQVGAKMNVKTIWLSHFSQRYPKLPKLTDLTHMKQAIFIGFDLMTLDVFDASDEEQSMKRKERSIAFLNFLQRFFHDESIKRTGDEAIKSE